LLIDSKTLFLPKFKKHDFDSELNVNRVGYVVSSLSFGLMKFDFKKNTITMQMRGDHDNLQQELIQTY